MNVREVMDRDQAWWELAPINTPVYVKSWSYARKYVYHRTSSQSYVIICVSYMSRSEGKELTSRRCTCLCSTLRFLRLLKRASEVKGLSVDDTRRVEQRTALL